MFYWPIFMREHRLEEQLASLSQPNVGLFATACAQHAVIRFEEYRLKGRYLPSRSDFFLLLLEVLEENWRSIPKDVRSFAVQERNLAMLWSAVGEPSGLGNEGELTDSAEQAVECMKQGGSPWRAGLAAKNAYNAVAKMAIGRVYPGKAMKAEQIIKFEREDRDCQLELEFQLRCLVALHHMAAPPATFEAIQADSRPRA